MPSTHVNSFFVHFIIKLNLVKRYVFFTNYLHTCLLIILFL